MLTSYHLYLKDTNLSCAILSQYLSQTLTYRSVFLPNMKI